MMTVNELRVQTERDAWRNALESLTPGGSEFDGEPLRCLEWVQDRLAFRTKMMAEVKALRAELAAVTAERDALRIQLDGYSESLSACEVELSTVTAERDAWHNDAEAKADALEASRAECNQWARKVATVEAERDALRAKADAVPWDAIGGMLFELRGGRPWHERVKDWYESHNAVGK